MYEFTMREKSNLETGIFLTHANSKRKAILNANCSQEVKYSWALRRISFIDAAAPTLGTTDKSKYFLVE